MTQSGVAAKGVRVIRSARSGPRKPGLALFAGERRSGSSDMAR
jgi:hypothetical protein